MSDSMVVAEEKRIFFHEGAFSVKTLETESEWCQAYRLRHRVFAERLKWVPERPDRLEADMYDAWSTSIGVFTADSILLGLVRMTHAPVPFMLESEFSACLTGTHPIRKELDTAEITRLAVDPHVADRTVSTRVMQAAIKGAYLWCVANDVRYTYIVVEERLLRGLRLMGWPCQSLGAPVSLPPAQAVSVAALIDLETFRLNASAKRPEVLKWYSTAETVSTGASRCDSPVRASASEVGDVQYEAA
ncbi:N-acyl-L-homoserine lactone synthase [Nitrospira japonica]|uniref:N-acyl-L-homoserine lactone synthase n=1 Tax=Nitrospira japonica TaxID=1325564 RepID=A0A1W1I451_9BACT|nr:acyl-homoserine-lactone synthase [Nitrospira japonica]SLM47782.1 N-acyl-L-homoserine lactone synthase [Nitrospira japonica]